ncbi:MAG TPA: aldo/keto reductase [Candidatus Marinimicrobia bacterium]|nr:aldo/keto reductase [Candidatus Neomarinimicrobiota bacterium]
MEYRKLGARGPEVSVIGFGAWAIGGMNWGKTDDTVSKKALHTAFDAGVNFVDTADVYGFGHSEKLISEVLKERGPEHGIKVATKAGNDFYNADKNDDAGYGPIRQTYTKAYLISAAEKSLKRLNLETLTILQLHSPDLEKLKQDEPWLALEQLKRDGKIEHAGLSIQSFKETDQAFLLDEHHDLLDLIQVRYNLLERDAESVLFPKAEKYGIGVIARIPLLFGFLTGKFSRQSQFSDDDHRSMNLSREKIESYFKMMSPFYPLYDDFPNYSKAQIALQFCLHHPAVSTVIPGAKSPEQVLDNCGAADLPPISFGDYLR